MDDLVFWAAAFLLVGGIGWLFGIAGFVRAGRALREVAELRRQMASAPLAMVPAALPDPAPTVTPEAVPVSPWAEPIARAEPAPRRTLVDIEALLTARWGVWLGAVALLLSGVFLVRYAADEGWLNPGVRCAGLAIMGGALIALGLRAARRPVTTLRFADQVPAGLAAGGVAMLFGAAYAAGIVYDLLSPTAAFILMAAASLAGLAVSLKLGRLVAAVGIVGAFATPLLIDPAEPSYPGLFAYLLFVSAASLAVVRYAAWVWLGWATTIAGAAWVLLATATAPLQADWSAALFVPALAVLHLALLPGAALDWAVGRRLAWVPVLAVGGAGLLLALVDPTEVTRAGVLLLAPITLLAAAREERLVGVPWVAATLFLLLMAFWGLPAWSPTAESIGDGAGGVVALLPGDWTPAALRAFLSVLAGMTLLFAAAGVAGVWRLRRRVAWASFAAAVPPLALALGFARVRQFQPDAAWSAAAVAAAAALVGLTGLTMRGGRGAPAAGVLAAGAAASLALGCAALLSAQWLTLALVLLVPALAWIESVVDLPSLRRVALAAAAVALVRLLLNAEVLDYVLGAPALWNGRALAYAVAAVSFWVGSGIARRRADDRLVAVLELGCAAFVTALVMLEIRQWFTGGTPAAATLGFAEAGLQVSALGLLALVSLWLDGRAGRASLRWSWIVQGSLALAGGVALLAANPLWTEWTVDGPPLLDALLTAYALPALLAILAARRLRDRPNPLRALVSYALLAALTWVTLEVRHIAHPGLMELDEVPVLPWELWAWSGAWLAVAVALMLAGLRARVRALRLAALAVMAVVILKVFLVDMSGLTGLWRVLSFLGLGLTLIGLGRLYGRLSKTEAMK